MQFSCSLSHKRQLPLLAIPDCLIPGSPHLPMAALQLCKLSHIRYFNKTAALQLHADLKLLPFVPHVVRICAGALQRGTQSCRFPRKSESFPHHVVLFIIPCLGAYTWDGLPSALFCCLQGVSCPLFASLPSPYLIVCRHSPLL